jgi:hypothetical protein
LINPPRLIGGPFASGMSIAATRPFAPNSTAI